LSRRGLFSALTFFGGTFFPMRSRTAESGGDWKDVLAGFGAPEALQTKIRFPGGVLTGSTETARIIFGQGKDIVIDGNGTVLKLTGKGGPFHFKNCENISLKNFTVDHQTHGYIQADPIDSTPDRRHMTVRVQSGFPALVFNEIASIFFFDTTTSGPARGSVELGKGSFTSVRPIGPSLYAIEFAIPVTIPDRATLIFRLRSGSGPAFLFENCKSIVIDHVTITAAPQMGFAFRRCEDLTVRTVVVKAAEGSGRLLATGADGLHASQTRGKITIANCTFEGLGDDCINVHDFYLRSAAWKSQGSLQLTERTDFSVQHDIKSRDNLPRVGDTIQLVDPLTMNVLAEAKIANIDASIDRPFLELTAPVDNKVAGQSVLVCSISAAPDLDISHCHFARTRARGVLTHAKTRIDGCSFENIALSAVLVLADGQFWGEGCETAHVKVMNSVFNACGLVHAPGAIDVSSLGSKGAGPVQSVGSDITITGNKFTACATPVLSVANINGLDVSSNIFSWKEAVTGPSVTFEQISNLTFEANRSSPESAVSLPQMERPVFKNNSGFKMKF